MPRRPQLRRRTAVLAIGAIALFAPSCSSEIAEPVAGSSEPATIEARPASELAVVSAIDAVAQSGTSRSETSPTPGANPDRTARDLEISSLAPSGAEPTGPNLDGAPAVASSSWAAQDAASTASFDAVLVPGTPSGEPEWPADLLTLTATDGNACVADADYRAVREAFGEQTSLIFEVDGALWLFTLDTSLRAGC